MEDAFLAIADRLQAAGLSPEETALQLRDGLSDPDHWTGEDLHQLAALAAQAGWREEEAAAGIRSLVENFTLSVDERRKTGETIRLAWTRPD